jgi:hypothetical protein
VRIGPRWSLMISLQTRRGPFEIVEIYYPQPQDICSIPTALSFNQIVYVRQAPRPLLLNRLHVRYAPFETILFDLTRNARELFADMNQNCRRQIRQAERIRDRIEVRRNDASAYRDFRIMNNELAAIKKHVGSLSEGRLDAIKCCADVFVAYFEARPICGHVIIRDEMLRRVGLVWSASTRLKGQDKPIFVGAMNRWLHWYEMRNYQTESMMVYDFGGSATDTPETESIARFKSSFGGIHRIEHNYIISRIPGRLAVRAFYGLRRLRAPRANHLRQTKRHWSSLLDTLKRNLTRLCTCTRYADH